VVALFPWRREMIINDSILLPLVGDPPTIPLNAVNMVFPPPCIHLSMETLSICISLFDIFNSYALLSKHTIKHFEKKETILIKNQTHLLSSYVETQNSTKDIGFYVVVFPK
jgi:hypothetical protein